jgi:rubredoxin
MTTVQITELRMLCPKCSKTKFEVLRFRVGKIRNRTTYRCDNCGHVFGSTQAVTEGSVGETPEESYGFGYQDGFTEGYNTGMAENFGWKGLTPEETNRCINENMTIVDPLLRDAVQSVIVDVEATLMEKNYDHTRT